MSAVRVAGSDRLRRGVPAVVVLGLVSVAALAVGGRAAAQAGRAAAGGVISTAAGGVGGPGRATKVSVQEPCGVSHGAGRVYIADLFAVRKVNPQTDHLTTAAGTGTFYGPLGNGGPAVRAELDTCGVAVDHSGNLVIADAGHQRVRVVAAASGTFYGRAMTKGDIYTVAGNGTDGFSGDGGPATKASLDVPYDVAVDGAGNLVIADTDNNRVRVVAARTGTFYGRAMTGGHIYTVAGNGSRGFSGDGGPATGASLNALDSVAVDGAGNLVIADTDNNRVRVVAARTGTFYGRAMTAGDIYTVAGNGRYGFSGDGGPATKAELNFVFGHGQTEVGGGVAADGAGNLLIADSGNSRIRVVAARTGTFYARPMTAGDIYTVAGNGTQGFSGDGGPATAAELLSPLGVAADGAGNLLIADTYNRRIREVTG